ncbi:MAG: TonB-dependent receptor [Myxococcota bacterium]|nr:TonB-dependent receptor [Myxococcota bacterium]
MRHAFVVLVVLLPSSTGWAQNATAPVETIEVQSKRLSGPIDADRATARTTRKQIVERQPQSTPDALKYSPGVYVQQTAHGQGSPYIRGRTGQQTLFLFDGLRLNHALFRKGPNQYLFTVDARTLASIDVVRGSSSVLYGNDAIAGAVLLAPIEPALDPTIRELTVRPSAFARVGSADGEMGGRLQLDAQIGGWIGILVGVGARRVGQLEAGGDAFPDGRTPNQTCTDIYSVPCFEADGRTQLGTGFKEFTADGRLVMQWPTTRLTLATYIYRQYDAPRTDQCPPPEAAKGECLIMLEQFRTHAYAKVDTKLNLILMDRMNAAFGWQRQHQRHRLARPDRITSDDIDTGTFNQGRDKIDGLSGYTRLETQGWRIGSSVLTVRYGLDGSYERVESDAAIRFVQPPLVKVLSRGLYINESLFLQTAAFVSPEWVLGAFRVRVGARGSYIGAKSPGDPASASRAFTQTHWPVVYNAGLSWGTIVSVFGNIEQGFRSPNLDDLTARQSTGQGYQLENPALQPERALTYEGGVRLNTTRVTAEWLGFYQTLDSAIERRLLTPEDCRISDDFVDNVCRANRAPVQLVNLTGTAVIYGTEAHLKLRPVRRWSLGTVISYARGEGDNPGPGEPKRVPLSRIPPLNGHVEISWRNRTRGLMVSTAVRWALMQDRLSNGDVADARIPDGGTAGYAVVDLRFGHRINRRVHQTFMVENLSDQRYRTHGSGVFGAGRSIVYSINMHF